MQLTCHTHQKRIGLRELKQALRVGTLAERRDQSSVAFASGSLKIDERVKGGKLSRCAQAARGELAHQRAALPKQIWRISVFETRGTSKLL